MSSTRAPAPGTAHAPRPGHDRARRPGRGDRADRGPAGPARHALGADGDRPVLGVELRLGAGRRDAVRHHRGSDSTDVGDAGVGLRQCRAPPATTATATPAAATTATGGPTGADVVADAKKYLGIPYVWGGESTSGLDCSGLVQKTFGDLGISLPRVAADQAHSGTPVASLADAQPGDLLFFGNPAYHVAIYAGNNQLIESPEPGKTVHITDVYQTPTSIRRIVPEAGTASGRRRRGATGAGPDLGPADRRRGLPRRRQLRRTSSLRPSRPTACPAACSPPSPSRSPAATRTRSARPARRA